MGMAGISHLKTYLSFSLDGEDYAVDVANVREVLDDTRVTRVPRTPDFMKGVINLRGGVVPVIDMRMKFGLERVPPTVDTCIIVLEVDLEGERTYIGALVDSVKAVFEMSTEEIEPPPSLGIRGEREFIAGMGKSRDRFIMILNPDTVFSTQELSRMTASAHVNRPGDFPGLEDPPDSRVEDPSKGGPDGGVCGAEGADIVLD